MGFEIGGLNEIKEKKRNRKENIKRKKKAHQYLPGQISSILSPFFFPRVLHPGFRGPKPEREIITRCAGTKSHTYDE
jgi:hypothetical protein